MKNIFCLLVSITACVFGGQSCTKHSPPVYPDNRISVPQVLSDYGYFKVGSFWVYQDSASLALDSVYITSAKEGTFTTAPSNSQPYHGYFGYFNTYTQSVYEGRQFHYSVNTENTFNGHSDLVEDEYINPSSNAETYLMTDYFVVGKPDPDGGYPVAYENLYDSLKVLNYYFKNAMLFHDGKNQTQNNSATNYYLAKNIGIIRKEILTPYTIWNLVRYHIVQ